MRHAWDPETGLDEHRSQSCDEHPHCTFCGGVMVDEGSRVVCVSCRIDAPIVNVQPAEREWVA